MGKGEDMKSRDNQAKQTTTRAGKSVWPEAVADYLRRNPTVKVKPVQPDLVIFEDSFIDEEQPGDDSKGKP